MDSSDRRLSVERPTTSPLAFAGRLGGPGLPAIDPSPAHRRPAGRAARIVLSMSTRWQQCDIASGRTSAIAAGMHAPVLPYVASIGGSIPPFLLPPIKTELQCAFIGSSHRVQLAPCSRCSTLNGVRMCKRRPDAIERRTT